MPFILYCYGGYAFDLDTKAVQPIQPAEAPKEFLVLNKGKIAAALAMVAQHEFAIYSLLYLHNFINKSFPAIKSFHSFEVIKDRKDQQNNRIAKIIATTGSILSSAFCLYAIHHDAYNSTKNTYNNAFLTQTSFRVMNSTRISMGIEFELHSNNSFWRKKRNPAQSFDIDNADISTHHAETRRGPIHLNH
jgi:hypothetical protein